MEKEEGKEELCEKNRRVRACLAQLNFNSETVFLENSFMSNFIGKAEQFWKKCLVK